MNLFKFIGSNNDNNIVTHLREDRFKRSNFEQFSSLPKNFLN